MKKVIKWSLLIAIMAALFYVETGLAVASGIAVSTIATNISKSVGSFVKILEDIALVTGIGFIMASFFKFHQHKLNPTQVPISQGVTLLLIGAALVVFPTLLPTATKAVFGSTAKFATTGGGATSLVGG